MEYKIKNNNRTYLTVILVIGLIFILLPTTLRYMNSNYFVYSGNSYKSLMSLEESNIYSYFVNSANFVFLKNNIIIIALIVQLLLGLLNLYIFFKIINEISKNSEIAFYSSLVLASSTVYIFLFSSINSYGLAIFLSLAGFYLFLKEMKTSFIFFLLLPQVNFYVFIAVILFLLIYTLFYPEKTRLFYIILVFSVFSGLYVLYTQPIYLQLFLDSNNSGFLSLLGSLTGYSIPFLMLVLIGLTIQYKKSTIITTFLLLICILLSFSSAILRIFNVFILSLYAGVGIFFLINRKWELIELKKILLMLVVCSFLFSSLAFCNLLKSQMPNNKYYEAMFFLQQKTDNSSQILSSEDNSYFIQYFTERKTFLDEESYIHYNYKELVNTSKEIYSSRNLKLTIKNLNNSGITHIFIDEEMKQRLWQGKEDGLYFLLKHNENFINLYNNNGYEIWRYNG